MSQGDRYYGANDYRAVKELLAEMRGTLRATNSGFRRNVLIMHEDGSRLFFRCAFLERLDEWILVLTEHHGYHAYHHTDLCFYKQYRQQWVPGPEWDIQALQAIFNAAHAQKPVRIRSARHRFK